MFASTPLEHAFSHKPAQGALARLVRVRVKADKGDSEASGFNSGLKGVKPIPHPSTFHWPVDRAFGIMRNGTPHLLSQVR